MSQRGFFYGWVVLAAAATIVAIGQGALFSLGVFLKPLEDSMRWSRSAISLVALTNWIAMGLGSFFWGALSDRLGSRGVTVAGGVLLGTGLVLSSQATALWQLNVTFGVAVGFAAGAFLAPLSATATKWFTANRGLAVGVVSAGGGAGMLLLSPLTRWLTSLYDWRVAMLVLGVSGLSSIAGRVGSGLLADRFGAKRTLVAGLALQAAMVFSYLFTRDAWSFFAAAVVFGIAYGGVMPLYALGTREYFGEKVMGTAYGAVFLISTLGMGFGSFAGGWIHDALGTYAWLFLASTAIGAGAMALAFTFRPPRILVRGAA